VMSPVRKVIPPMGGLDFSPIFIFIGIGLIRNIIYQSFGVNEQVALVVIGL
jgi:YggT family protein